MNDKEVAYMVTVYHIFKLDMFTVNKMSSSLIDLVQIVKSVQTAAKCRQARHT